MKYVVIISRLIVAICALGMVYTCARHERPPHQAPQQVLTNPVGERVYELIAASKTRKLTDDEQDFLCREASYGQKAWRGGKCVKQTRAQFEADYPTLTWEAPVVPEKLPISPGELCMNQGGEWAGQTCFSKDEKKVIYECLLCAPGTEENVVNTWHYPPNWSCGKCEPKEIR